MALVWICVALLAAAVTAVLLKKSPARPAPRARAPVRGLERAAVATQSPRAAPASAEVTAATAPIAAMPPELAAFHLQLANELTEERRQSYVATFKDVPRPPKLLHRLISPDFVNEASSSQLVDLIIGEPLIAAKVLAMINSPMYGLKAPVSSIGHAVTYLGLNTIRVTCLRYILIASFKADSPERQKRLDAAWNASALASELAQQLAQRLGFEDRGALVSAVVLSFLGRLAITASVPAEQLASIPARGLLGRMVAEQKALGLSAAQIGRLLMQSWALPGELVEDAAAIDGVVVTPSSAVETKRGSRLALCYVCARLGERLAEGSLAHLASFEPQAASDAELFHLQGYLAQPPLLQLPQIVRSAELNAAIERMLTSIRR